MVDWETLINIDTHGYTDKFIERVTQDIGLC